MAQSFKKVLPQCKVTLLRKISQGLVRITIRWWSLKCSNDIRRCLVNHFQNQTEVHTTYTDIAQRTDGTRANTSRANHPNLKVRSWYMRDHIIILRLNFPAKLQKTGKFPSLWLAFSSVIPNWLGNYWTGNASSLEKCFVRHVKSKIHFYDNVDLD